jgi:hypothetical protein
MYLPKRARPTYMTDALRSHFRPVRHLPALLSPDTVQSRVVTQPEAERIPYRLNRACC